MKQIQFGKLSDTFFVAQFFFKLSEKINENKHYMLLNAKKKKKRNSWLSGCGCEAIWNLCSSHPPRKLKPASLLH